MFAALRALVLAGTVILAFDLDLDLDLDLFYGYWIPIAAIAAMKPSLQQTTLVSLQRLTGAVIGAILAALLLLLPASKTGLRLFAVKRGLEVLALVLLMHGAGIRFLNYTLYSASPRACSS
ncbi:hypothetical protein OV450_6419 [Actinobacteria bacterium OV450]|nr:hypothetical protein OV450_6419 [Actinobacteria bacterium OV450]